MRFRLETSDIKEHLLKTVNRFKNQVQEESKSHDELLFRFSEITALPQCRKAEATSLNPDLTLYVGGYEVRNGNRGGNLNHGILGRH